MLSTLLLSLLACDDVTVSDPPTCALSAPAASPATAAPGDVVTLTTGPLTEVWDTLLTVGGVRAEVGDVTRAECDDCDTCFTTEGVGACGACDSSCATCVETVTFTVPSLAAGTWPVEVANRHGRSPRIDFVVTAPSGDTGDTGASDTGETGASETADSAAR